MMIDAFDGYGLIYTYYIGVKQFLLGRSYFWYICDFTKYLLIFSKYCPINKEYFLKQKSLKQGHESMIFFPEWVSTNCVFVSSSFGGYFDIWKDGSTKISLTALIIIKL